MAGIEGNPFADPFADPSVVRAAQASSTTQESNPFDKSSAVPQTTSYGSQPASTMSPDDIFRQQEELKRKEEELRRRQQEFDSRQAQAGSGGSGSNNVSANRPHNWPPLPTIIPIEPCFYQDIDVEIPVQFQKIVTTIYYVYLIYVGASALNVVASFLFLLFGEGSVGIFALSIIEMLIFSSCSFLFWFRPVYKAFRDDSSFNFMVFFFVLFFHTIFCLVQALGLSEYACGWINGIKTIGSHTLVGLIMLLPAIAYTAAFVGMSSSLLRVHKLYRGAGFSMERARKEFTDGVMSDRNVQNATNTAARAAAAHAVNQTVNQGRY
uniref:Secretory carrier-associated membrane protein n=1 Tax=Rhabditophanes sp. KR3021 TaxID=114890 RepID=A0AC35TNW8_9BILA